MFGDKQSTEYQRRQVERYLFRAAVLLTITAGMFFITTILIAGSEHNTPWQLLVFSSTCVISSCAALSQWLCCLKVYIDRRLEELSTSRESKLPPSESDE